ncbi:MAG: hypothetical protein Q8P89_04095 [bacterium]|nr:hypothetical protein [bacterium]
MRLWTARVISAFSHPVVVFPASVPFFAFQVDLAREQVFSLIPALFVLAIPLLYFLYALRRKKISDWEVTERRERYVLYFLSLLCGGLGLWLLQPFGSRSLITVALIFYLLGIFVTLINFAWKISAHAAGITTGALTFNLLLGQSPLFYFLIPLVVWGRYVEQKHTPAQLLAGVILGVAVVFGVLTIRGGPVF